MANRKTDTEKRKLSMEAAAKSLVAMGVRTRTQFNQLKKDNQRPDDIPSHPERFYEGFSNWKAFISLGLFPNFKLTYQNLKKQNTLLNLTTRNQYNIAIREGKLPPSSPKDPEVFFDEQWKGWDDFLAPKQGFISFEEARRFARKLGLSSSYEWRQYCRTGAKPDYIPVLPDRDYPEFETWQDFLIEPE